LKVLFVTPHVFEGGAEKAVLNLVYHLSSMGCDASIATLSLDLTKLPTYLAKLSFILPEKPLEQPVMKDVGKVVSSTAKEIFSFMRLLKEFSSKFDLVCACNFPTYWATYLAWTKKPVLWLSSEVLGPVNQTRDVYDRSPFFRLVLGFTSVIDKIIVNGGLDPIVTCSELNSVLIEERYGRDALVINTGVDYDFFNAKSPGYSEHLKLGDGPILLQVGALMQRKNQILSIRALKILKQRLPHAKLVLVGEGPWKPILQKEAKRLGLDEDVIFAGRISEDELRSFYHACDVSLFPVKDQTWGLVPFEALAAGKPSVVAEGCGAAEIIRSEKIGFLIKPDVEELAYAVLFALKHPEICEDMVKRGQRYVRENLTWDKYAAKIYSVFMSVLHSE
jgi:glycosyltransferase involved in cell wall biosynthesis